jgi:hypothetical protein
MHRIPCRIARHLAAGAGRVRSPAGIASARLTPRRRKQFDFPTGNCGLSLPMPFETNGTVSVPVKMTPILTEPGPAERPGNRIGVGVGKPSSKPVTRDSCRRGSVRARAGPVGGQDKSGRNNQNDGYEWRSEWPRALSGALRKMEAACEERSQACARPQGRRLGHSACETLTEYWTRPVSSVPSSVSQPPSPGACSAGNI